MLTNYESCRIEVLNDLQLTLIDYLNTMLVNESNEYIEGFKAAIELVKKEIEGE